MEKFWGSPIDKRKTTTAGEELDAKIKEMENRDNQLRTQIQMLEDENNAERIMYSHQMQSIKDEYSEFDHQYNHVLSCWRQAEEKSKTFEMEQRSGFDFFRRPGSIYGKCNNNLDM